MGSSVETNALVRRHGGSSARARCRRARTLQRMAARHRPWVRVSEMVGRLRGQQRHDARVGVPVVPLRFGAIRVLSRMGWCIEVVEGA